MRSPSATACSSRLSSTAGRYVRTRAWAFTSCSTPWACSDLKSEVTSLNLFDLSPEQHRWLLVGGLM